MTQYTNQELTTEQMYLQLTDGDMDFNEYLNCLPVRVESCINQKKEQHQQCIKCSFANRFKVQHCILRNYNPD
jgi:hypothetical protein